MADYKIDTFLRYFFLIIVAVSKVQSSDYKVVCYYNYWSNYYSSNGKFQVEDIDPFLCTHLVYAYVGIDKYYDVLMLDPQLQGGEPYRGRRDFLRFIELKRKNQDLKVLVAFGGYNGNHARFSSLLIEPNNRKDFIRNLRIFIKSYCLPENKSICFDGVSLDYYYPTSLLPEFNDFLAEIRDMFDYYYPGEKERKIIAVAASGLGTNIKEYYAVPKIAKLVDFVSLLTYDYHGPTWSNNKTGTIAPLYGRKLVNGGQDTLNQNATVHTWLDRRIGDVDPKKLLLGMPTYGRSFNLLDSRMTKLGDPTTGAATIGPYTHNPGYFTYNECINQIFPNDKNWKIKRAVEQRVPYAYNGNLWISYEDEISFDEKAKYIKTNSLGGAMINSIDSDDFKNRYPLIQVVKDVLLGDGVTPTPPSSFKCEKTGLFTNTQNCTKYYQCNRQPDGSFRQFDLVCPKFLGFDESVCECNWLYDVAACLNPNDFVSQGCIPEEWTDFIP